MAVLTGFVVGEFCSACGVTMKSYYMFLVGQTIVE